MSRPRRQRTYRSSAAKTFGQSHSLGFRLKLQAAGQHVAAIRVRTQGSCAISLSEAQSHQAAIALFLQGIEAQPAAHGLDSAFHISRSFVDPRQGTKELVNAQVPVLPVLARPIVEKGRVAQREAGQERAASQARGLLELRQPRFRLLARRRVHPTPDVLAESFDDAKVQQEGAVLLQCKCLALHQQVSSLPWGVRALKELAQLEQGRA